jgi:hypothetical protein
MRRLLIAGCGARFRKGFNPVDQGIAQALKTYYLRLLGRQHFVQFSQQMLLVRKLGLNLNQSIFVHGFTMIQVSEEQYGRHKKCSIPK